MRLRHGLPDSLPPSAFLRFDESVLGAYSYVQQATLPIPPDAPEFTLLALFRQTRLAHH